MKVNDLRLHLVVKSLMGEVKVFDQDGFIVFAISWGIFIRRNKTQAIAIANRLCDRFNTGQEGK